MNGLLLLAHLAWAYPGSDYLALGPGTNDDAVCIVRNFQKKIVPPGQILDWTPTNLVFEFTQEPFKTESNGVWRVTLSRKALTNEMTIMGSITNAVYFITASCAHQWDYRIQYAGGGRLERICKKCKKTEEPIWR